ncbi:conserved hypothetical protein [Shewanella denitrificans OS217]|jgi:hypothetical protein|uniref:DUF3703 domain-containing protein n=1 Tax=Shewanella denitrificans (strain OS217 / ATCC BAA-1090 / DSM 15013) TaxID=318161 RepID=Q12HS2_SHEDO|nr:DUF3703 domain-containing protein [Shewanella denitrificans]ABE57004.1 conserved hypothetical protein [Shewanella denitrificans OS217]
MNKKQQQGYDLYYRSAKKNLKKGNYQQAMTDLGYCHILSKNSYLQHLKIHWRMLLVGFKNGNLKEVRVQMFRCFMAFATAPMLAGTQPNGNPGDSNHGFFDKLTIPEILQEYF